jgi:hypothetical protein
MPEHFHILITPSATLERAVQFIKGGFSYRTKKELQSSMEVWQAGFSDHRIRDAEDYQIHVEYIYRNPVGRKLVERAAEYPYCSAFAGSMKDEVPQWLKPYQEEERRGAPKGAPLRQQQSHGPPEGAPLRQQQSHGPPEGAPLQQQIPRGLKPARDDNSDYAVNFPDQDELLVTKK